MHCDATACIALIRRWAVRLRVLQLAEFAPKFVVRAEVVGSRRSSIDRANLRRLGHQVP